MSQWTSKIKHQSLSSNRLTNRHVYSWGWGIHGCLGHGNYNDINLLSPQKITSLSNENIIQISSGWSHCYALTSSGKLYRWGWIDDIKTMYSSSNLKINFPGLLNIMQSMGDKYKTGFITFNNALLIPTLIPELRDLNISYVNCGAGTTFVITNNGNIYSWGIGKWGQLGHKIYNHYTEIFNKPIIIDRLLDHNIITCSTGYAHTLFLDKTGCIWCCGLGLNGRLGLGIGSRLGEYPIPRPMTPLWKQHFKYKWHKHKYLTDNDNYITPYKSITSSSSHNNDNETSSGYYYHNYPHYDDSLYNPSIIKISAGHKHSAILTSDGLVWTYGCGMNGALGHKYDYTDKYWPTLVEDLLNEYIIDISCGSNHTVVLAESGNVYTFGMSRYGQCGRSRNNAFMLQDIRERGCNLNESLNDIQKQNRQPFILNNNNNYDNNNLINNYYNDQNDGILLKGDPLCMNVGKIDIPNDYKIEKVIAGFYETSLITKCGKAIIYGCESEKLENEPIPKIIEFPNERILQISHGWKHTLCLTEDN